MNKYYVYILKCSDNSYYTGVTNNLEKRIVEHNSGHNSQSYTFKRRPVELVYYEVFQNINDSIAFEKQIKGWSRRKKEAVISNEWHKLPDLSRNRSSTQSSDEVD